ncbi:MAG: gamma-glutamylcyclotransferase [Rhodobacteraceae bacterium]|nr:gamma-glutamylcyclotransferase [Paracoccaceae bacterium]
MTPLFFYGTLQHLPLLETILGGARAKLTPAWFPDHEVLWAKDEAFPMIQSAPGKRAEGLLVEDLDADGVARLDFYELGFGYELQDVTVETESGPAPARVYFPEPGLWTPGDPWSLQDWADRWGDLTCIAAKEELEHFDAGFSAEEVVRRDPQIRQRAAARLNASLAEPPAKVRADLGRGDISVTSHTRPYTEYFAVEEMRLTHRQFDGTTSPEVRRAAFVQGDAVTVLPYDPVRDRVLLVEQFRFGPFVRGDKRPWQLEAVAWRLDPGETPEDTARREAAEESSLNLGDLHLVAEYYPSPGAITEYVYSYVAMADLPDGAGGIGGLDTEHEDIRNHVLSFADAFALIASGEIVNAPLILTLQWLSTHRERLRGAG